MHYDCMHAVTQYLLFCWMHGYQPSRRDRVQPNVAQDRSVQLLDDSFVRGIVDHVHDLTRAWHRQHLVRAVIVELSSDDRVWCGDRNDRHIVELEPAGVS
jgi:hypothetical protein